MARRNLLAMLLPTPDEIVRSYLTTDERMILVDQPSTKAFVVEAIREILILGLLLIFTGYVAVQGSSAVAAIGFIAIDILAIVLIIQRMQRWFTRYVLTDFRVIRSWGILNRQMAWIPWAKVTDISLTQTFLGRTFGYATVRIESANEASGFKEINDLREPHRFHRVISEMVEAKQGKTVPYWMQPPGVGLPSQVAPDNVLFD
jgi:membrane protein YdbS with pleckstrin-like domain